MVKMDAMFHLQMGNNLNLWPQTLVKSYIPCQSQKANANTLSQSYFKIFQNIIRDETYNDFKMKVNLNSADTLFMFFRDV